VKHFYQVLGIALVSLAVFEMLRGNSDRGYILALFVGSMAARAHAEILELRDRLRAVEAVALGKATYSGGTVRYFPPVEA
jgi:hypothetical protein